MVKLKHKLELFLMGYPYGLLGKVYRVADGHGKYTWWDKVRYYLLVGERIGD